MNNYESVIIVDPTLDEKQQKEIVDKYSKIVNKNGKLDKIEILGKRKLAYEIKGNKEGFYIVFYFESEQKFTTKLERKYKIDEDIIKFIIIRED